MKRSEIQLIIAECLIEPHFEDPLKEASFILKRLEKAGMLPPPDGVEAVTNDIIYAYYDERVVSDDDGRPIVENLWEPEE